mmetsp:Transcript_10546/g.31239  ORF Transcript_10546/g.31239 Transcript_10546/m.31239 type:complete len:228 (-) Transcript_10546:157-840(-)
MLRRRSRVTPFLRKRPPWTRKTSFSSTAKSGISLKTRWNVEKSGLLYLLRHSSMNPPPILNVRVIICSFSWFPRRMWMLPGCFSLNAASRSQISTAKRPRSTISPLKRYTFVSEGTPWVSKMWRTSMICPCVSPTTTMRGSGPPSGRLTSTTGLTSPWSCTSMASMRLSATSLFTGGSKGILCSFRNSASGSIWFAFSATPIGRGSDTLNLDRLLRTSSMSAGVTFL